MTNKDIERLAREFTDELFAGDDLTDQQTIEEKNDCYVTCMAFCGYLLEKHCIVPKEYLQELYDCFQQNEQAAKRLGLEHPADIAHGSTATMRDIFGTELFEERR